MNKHNEAFYDAHRYNIDFMVSMCDNLVDYLNNLKITKKKRYALESALASFVGYIDKTIILLVEEKDTKFQSFIDRDIHSEVTALGANIEAIVTSLRLKKAERLGLKQHIDDFLDSINVTLNDALVRNDI